LKEEAGAGKHGDESAKCLMFTVLLYHPLYTHDVSNLVKFCDSNLASLVETVGDLDGVDTKSRREDADSRRAPARTVGRNV
jgi:hypothetical protein